MTTRDETPPADSSDDTIAFERTFDDGERLVLRDEPADIRSVARGHGAQQVLVPEAIDLDHDELDARTGAVLLAGFNSGTIGPAEHPRHEEAQELPGIPKRASHDPRPQEVRRISRASASLAMSAREISPMAAPRSASTTTAAWSDPICA